MSARWLVFLLVLSVSLTLHVFGHSRTGTAAAQEVEQERPLPPDTMRIKADSLTFDQQSMSGTAVGDVKIFYEQATLEAGEVFLDLDDKTSYAKERVRLLQGRDVLYCEELQYHFKETARTDEYVELTDVRRRMAVRIYNSYVTWSQSGTDQWHKLSDSQGHW